MRPDLVTTQGLSLLLKGGLKLSSDALPFLGRDDSEGNDLGFSKIFALPLNGRAISIRSDILEDKAQKTHNLRIAPRNQNVRTGVPVSGEGKPIPLVEFGKKRQ